MDLKTARVYASRGLMSALVYAPRGLDMNDNLGLDRAAASLEEKLMSCL